MDLRPISPKSLLLDLLRVAPGTQPVKGVCEVGELFGFTSNAMRVAITRLVGRGLIESDERGWYRLAPVASPRSDWVERWRVGDKRIRQWAGAWLGIWLPRGQSRGQRRHTKQALRLMGFREGMPGLHVRPDNLVGGPQQAREQAQALGLEEGAELFVASDFGAALDRQLRQSLWPARAVIAECRSACRALRRSGERLGQMPIETAVVQSFVVGGQAIRVLATDPLLPDAIVDGTARRELTRAMLRYDAHGRRIWQRFVASRRLEHAPAHLSVVHAGAA